MKVGLTVFSCYLEIMKKYLKIIYAGFGGSSHMVTSTAVALGHIISAFKGRMARWMPLHFIFIYIQSSLLPATKLSILCTSCWSVGAL